MSDHGKSRRPGWPDKALTILRECWQAGLTAAAIADTINAAEVQAVDSFAPFTTTRNAVIGKARRDPLCPARESPLGVATANAPFRHKHRREPLKVQLERLPAGTCRWLEKGEHGGDVFCGMPSGVHRSWCDEHIGKAFSKLPAEMVPTAAKA